MHMLQEDEIVEKEQSQHHQRMSPPKWQSMRRIERGCSNKFFNPQLKTIGNLDQPTSNQERIKNSLKGTLFNVIKPRVQDIQFDTPESQLVKYSRKLNVNLEITDMERISFDPCRYFAEYEEQETLGEGCIGLVKAILERSTNIRYAVKQVTTNDEEIVSNMIKEFRSLAKLEHPNIVKVNKLFIDFKDGFQNHSTIYVVMEIVEGMEMFQHIQELGHYTEETTKKLFGQLLDGIRYLHQHGVCHRDLKPNNLLCSTCSSLCQQVASDLIKITDFNVSKFSENYKGFLDIQENDQIEMWTYTGTVAFSAPEIFVGYGYNEKVDLWSAGCILYTMLCGQMPFQEEYLNDLIDLICSGLFTFSADKWEQVSPEAKNLIENLLVVDPDQRFSAEQALSHEWFSNVQLNSSEQSQSTQRSLQRNQLDLNIKHLLRKTERKNTKQRTNCLLFGAKHLYHKARSDEQFYFDPFEKHSGQFARSAGLIKDMKDDLPSSDTLNGSATSIEFRNDEGPQKKSYFAHFQSSPQFEDKTDFDLDQTQDTNPKFDEQQ